MASAPVVIPGAVTKLADAVVINMALQTAQAIFTVPNGMRAVVTQVVVRDLSTSLTGTTNGNVTATFAFATAGALPISQSTDATPFSSVSKTGVMTLVNAAQTSAGFAANSGGMTAQVASIGSSTAATADTTNPLARNTDVLNVTLTYSVAAPATGNFCKVDVLGYLEGL